MSNRATGVMLFLVFTAIALLVIINTPGIFGSGPKDQILSRSSVLGMATLHGGKLYTLNFEQQNQVLDILNRSLKIATGRYLNSKQPKFGYDKLIIYLFDGKEISIVPITFENQQLIFQSPALNPNGLLRETGPGELNPLLMKTYPPL